MVDTTTSNFGFIKPENTKSDDTWGIKSNGNLDEIDRLIKLYSIAGNITIIPAGTVAATNVQAAVAELDGDLANRVRFDAPQTITLLQKKQARDNISAPSQNQARARNRILDPALQVSQQNSSAGSTATNYYASDAWHSSITGAGFAIGLSRPAAETPNGSPCRLRAINNAVKGTLATTDAYFAATEIEDVAIQDYGFGAAGAKRLTFKFGCKMPAGKWGVRFANAGATRTYFTTFTIAPEEAGIDVYRTIEVPGDVSGTWSKTSLVTGLSVAFVLTAGTAYSSTENVWTAGNVLTSPGCTNFSAMAAGTIAEFFDFQLFVGLDTSEEPPVFEVPSYADELVKCERYYETGIGVIYYTASGAGSLGMSALYFRRKKRAVPVVGTIAGTAALNNYSSGGYDQISQDGARFFMSASAPGGASATVGFFANARL